MKEKNRKGRVLALSVGIFLLAALLSGLVWFLNTHFFVKGKVCSVEAQVVDLTDRELSLAEYQKLRENLPDCRILWNVPFQGSAYPEDTEVLTVTELAEEDLEVLSFFPALREIHGEACRDYEMLEALRQRYPEIDLYYTVTVDGKEYPQDTKKLTVQNLTQEDIRMLSYLHELQQVDASSCGDYTYLAELRQIHPELEIHYAAEVLGQTFTEKDSSAEFAAPDLAVLSRELKYAVDLKTVHMEEPEGTSGELRNLLEQYPDIEFSWNKTVLGKTFSSGDSEIDLSGIALTSTGAVEKAMEYFPYAEKVNMSGCGFDNETMAAFREKMRPEYKVVWTVYVTRKAIRTDSEIIHSSALGVCFIDEQCYDLKYCEDAVVVDIGHSYVKYIDWVAYMPNLQYLILTHNWIKDLTPISSCKKLVYLEIYWNEHIPDYTPLLGCTALKDLNISGTYADPEPLQQMTWLENLWANATDFTREEIQALKEALPNTRIETTGGDYTSKGWRQVQGYYDMRDIMGLPYNTW